MFTLPSSITAALADSSSIVVLYAAVGITQSDNTVAWDRFTTWANGLTIGGESYNQFLFSASLPEGLAVNIQVGGGRGSISVQDTDRTLFEKWRLARTVDTDVRIGIVMLKDGAFSDGQQMTMGRIRRIDWNPVSASTQVRLRSRIAPDETNPVYLTSSEQSDRGDATLSESGEQTNIEWSG